MLKELHLGILGGDGVFSVCGTSLTQPGEGMTEMKKNVWKLIANSLVFVFLFFI